MNTTAFMGRLTADLELRHTQNGKAVCSFTLAVKRPRTKDITDFINFVAWEKTAEVISAYFRKGDMIGIEGILTSRRYDDKDGNKRTAFEVVVNNAYFAERKKGEGLPSVAAETPQNQFSVNSGDFEEIVGDEELPF